MSEPVSATEIEDVLTSIRRLVMENENATTRKDAETAEKLVLTPAFRVDSQRDAQPRGQVVELGLQSRVYSTAHGLAENHPEAPVSEAPMMVIEDDDALEHGSLEDRIAELEAAVDTCVSEFEPDGSEAPDVPERVVYRPEPALAAEPETDVAEVAFVAEPDAEAEVETQLEVEGEAAALDLDAPLTLTNPQVRDDTQPETAQAVEAEVHGAVADEAELAQDMAADPVPDSVDEAAAEALEADLVEDDLSEADVVDAEGAEVEWEDVHPHETGHLHFQSDGEEADYLDEEALRVMVARMVREELQGTVGERITHNVRRLVRREISRALALQDYD